MDDRHADRSAQPRPAGFPPTQTLAGEVLASAVLLGLALLAAVGVALLAHLLLPSGY